MDFRCYGCRAEDAKWRGPKSGWRCLRCYSETIRPTVRLAPDLGVPGESVVDQGSMPTVTRADLPDGGNTWTLTIPGPGPAEGAQPHPLGTNLSAEQAVDEAKWVLSNRA